MHGPIIFISVKYFGLVNIDQRGWRGGTASALVPTVRAKRFHDLNILNCYVQIVFEVISSRRDIDHYISIRKLLHSAFNICWDSVKHEVACSEMF